MGNSPETDQKDKRPPLWPLIHVGIPTHLSVVDGNEISKAAKEYRTRKYEEKPLVLPKKTKVSVDCIGKGGNSISLGKVELREIQEVKSIIAGRTNHEPFVIDAVQVVFELDSAVRRQFARGIRKRGLTDAQEEERLAGLFLIQNGLGYRLRLKGIELIQIQAIHLTALSDPPPDLNPGLTPRLSFREMRDQGRLKAHHFIRKG